MGRPGEGLAELLLEHGIPEQGVRVYLAAAREGPQTASELARISALNRVDAYRYIRQLEEQGLLHTTGGRPMRFAALPPEELIDRWIRTTAEKLDRLENRKRRILSAWQEGQLSIDGHDTRRFNVLEGREGIDRFLAKRIGAAQQQVLVSVGGSLLPSLLDAGVARALRQASGRGVKVRVVTEVSTANLADAKHFVGFSDLRHAVSPVTNRAFVIDRSGALVFVSGEYGLGRTGQAQVALWSTAPEFLELAREYHRRLWGPAIRSEARFVDLEVPDPAILPIVDGEDGEPFQRLREITSLGMRATGIRELKLHLAELIDTVARELGRQIAEEVDGSTTMEVASSLSEYYAQHAMGRLEVVKQKPLVLKVSGCFACTSTSPEIGRVMCPRLIRTVLETRLGTHWDVSKPDPTKHAQKGCLFAITPS